MKVKFFSLSMLAVATQLFGSSEAVTLKESEGDIAFLTSMLAEIDAAKAIVNPPAGKKEEKKDAKEKKNIAAAAATAPDKKAAKAIEKAVKDDKTSKKEVEAAVEQASPEAANAKAAKNGKNIKMGIMNPIASNNQN